jgi:nucleoside-diphosphate-sugar epimerase
MMRAVVTGCAGFIGSHLTAKLIDTGWTVVGIDCFSPTYDTSRRRSVIDRLSSNSVFEFIEGDINDIDLVPHVADADVVFHLAARPGVRASWDDFANASRANILGTQRILDAVSSEPDTRLVFASSSSVYGKAETYPTVETAVPSPISPYGVTKASCEALIGAYTSQLGIDVVSLRYFTVYGPRQRSDMAFTKWIRAGLQSESLPIYGDGSAVREFTYVADVVDATIAVAVADTSGHEVLNVAGGSPASVNDALALIENLIGQPLHLEHEPKAKGDPDRTGGSTERLTALTGWEPKWTLADGLAAQVEWLRSSGEMSATNGPYEAP